MTASFLWQAGTGNNGLLGTAFNFMADTSELASLANNAYVVSSVSGTSGVFKNNTTFQAIYGELPLTLGAIGSALGAGAVLSGWFLKSYDGGSTFEQTAAAPSRNADFYFNLPATTIAAAAVYWAANIVLLPAIPFKIGILNSTGQALAASGNTIKCAPVAEQY